MKPTKKQIIKMLTDATRLEKEEKKRSKAWDTLFSVVAPDSYAPIMDDNKLTGYLEAVKSLFGDAVKDDVEYWVYDAMEMNKKDLSAKFKGETYDISTKEKYAEFMLLCQDND